MAAALPLGELQNRVLLTQPMDLYEIIYTGTTIPWPELDQPVDETVWDAVGASPWNADLYGREGTKVSKPQEVMDYRGARSLGKLATVRTSDDLMLEGTIYDARLETVAFLLDQDLRDHSAAAAARAEYTSTLTAAEAAGQTVISVDPGAADTGINVGDTVSIGSETGFSVTAVDRTNNTITVDTGLATAKTTSDSVVRAALAAVPAVRQVGLSRPLQMREYSLVLRGFSAINDGLIGQVHIPRGRVVSAWDREFATDKWAGKTTFTVQAMVDYGSADPLDRLGFFREQTI